MTIVFLDADHYKQAKRKGIDKERLDYLFYEQGQEFHKIMDKPNPKVRNPNYRWFSKVWKVWGDKAVVSRDTMRDRVNRGMSYEEAAMTRNMREKNWSEEEKKHMRSIGVTTDMANARMSTGWSREDILNTPKMTTEERLERVRKGARNRKVNKDFNKNREGAEV